MTAAGVIAFIGLGSNLEQPLHQVSRALSALGTIPGTRLLRHSRLYRSAPLGPAGQADYINAVAKLRTLLAAADLLDALQAIEARHGRERGERWGPRTLDLDILLYGQHHIDTPRLRVPHPEMHRRPFVLVPLHEIAPDLVVSGWGRLADRVAAVGSGGIEALDQPPGD